MDWKGFMMMSMENNVPLETIQKIEFGILKYIRDVCDANGLRYYLAYGTLIGAVRHQGFIPWDDDMDIHMPRPDYMKFVEIVKRDPHPYYRLVSLETSDKYAYLWAKVIDKRTRLVQDSPWIQKEDLGFFVDIFVLDGAGKTLKEAEATYEKAFDIFKQYRRSVKKMFNKRESRSLTFARWIYHIPQRLLGNRYWMERHEKFCLQKAYDDCEYVGALGAGTKKPSRNVWKKDCFGGGTNVVFCGELFRAPENWDEVLRSEYGDYMMLPPVEQRQSNHNFLLCEVQEDV